MGKSVRETQAAVSSQEFTEWKAFEIIQVPDPIRSDWRTALSTSQIMSAVSGLFGKKGPEPASLLLKFPDPDTTARPTRLKGPNQASIRMKLEGWRAMFEAQQEFRRKKR